MDRIKLSVGVVSQAEFFSLIRFSWISNAIDYSVRWGQHDWSAFSCQWSSGSLHTSFELSFVHSFASSNHSLAAFLMNDLFTSIYPARWYFQGSFRSHCKAKPSEQVTTSSSVSYFPASSCRASRKWTDFNAAPARSCSRCRQRDDLQVQAAQCWKRPSEGSLVEIYDATTKNVTATMLVSAPPPLDPPLVSITRHITNMH